MNWWFGVGLAIAVAAHLVIYFFWVRMLMEWRKENEELEKTVIEMQRHNAEREARLNRINGGKP